ncbi:LOW QUALITY PROTEIN: uncharacterized protein LOC144327715 [Podarcis muralis]
MAPKKVAAHPGPASGAKRPIRGPSQALRSPTPSQPVGRVQSVVDSMAGNPVALSRFAADLDGFLQQCSAQPSASRRRPRPVVAPSPASPSSSEEERDGSSPGGLIIDSQIAHPCDLPASRGRSRRPRRSSGRAAGGKTPLAASTRRAVLTQPSDEVASVSGISLVVSPHSAPGTSQLSHDSESSIEDSRPVPARESSGGKRRGRRSSPKRAKQRRGEASSSYAAPGPSRQDPDSGSSIEDSLPVPSRRSSGGKRRRKRSSRRHAKRRRDDSSSSYTGTSSSSSDGEADSSIELYWGFGEAASGLPRWAWQRGANTHRARYGAVQECKDGVLVPDVKVSTNSARDVIPGSHLSTKLRARILNGRYVEIFKLTPPSEDQERVSSSRKRTGVSSADRTFERWLDCFQVFAGVVMAAYPRRSLHLLVYLSIVRSAFTKAGEKAAIKYDENFRRRAAKIPSARWDRKDLDVWTTYVAPLIDKKAPEQQRMRPGAFKTARRLTCWDFNKGSCQRQGCKFAHMCDRCNGLHPASSCYTGRRPFRGGKGGSQQTPKATPSASTPGTGK